MIGYVLVGFGIGVAGSNPAFTGAVIGSPMSNTFSILAALAFVLGASLLLLSLRKR